jgi:uracil-DNA glycosylase
MDTNAKKILMQHLEMDSFFTGDFAIRSPKPAAEAQEAPFLDTQTMSFPNKEQESCQYWDTLDQITSLVKQCQKCRLGKTRTNAVPGQGNPHAKLVFIGEGPGGDEDQQGLAFVGRAGKLLTDMITAMGLTRDEVFIGNIVKCRPPENRDPKPDEIVSCWPYLKRQMELIAPQVIVALGAHAARTLLKTERPIGQLRGQFQHYQFSESMPAAKLMPTYHPAYLLRNYSDENRRSVWEDLQKVMKELGLKPPKNGKPQ